MADSDERSCNITEVERQGRERAALVRCAECWEDGEYADVSRAMLDRLTDLGWLQKVARNRWEVTSVGMARLSTEGGADHPSRHTSYRTENP